MTREQALDWLEKNEKRYRSFGSLGEQFLREAKKTIANAIVGFNFEAMINNEQR